MGFDGNPMLRSNDDGLLPCGENVQFVFNGKAFCDGRLVRARTRENIDICCCVVLGV